MIPSVFVQLEKIPVTRNGKVDKKALPEAEFNNEKEYVEPSTLAEKVVAKAFENVFGINNVSVYDDFYELGGHSLKATQMVTYIRKELSVQISLRTIFRYSSVELIALEVQKLIEGDESDGEQIKKPDFDDFENIEDEEVN